MAVKILPPLGNKSIIMRPGGGSSRVDMRGMAYNDPAAKSFGVHVDDQKTIGREYNSEALASEKARFAGAGFTDIQR